MLSCHQTNALIAEGAKLVLGQKFAQDSKQGRARAGGEDRETGHLMLLAEIGIGSMSHEVKE